MSTIAHRSRTTTLMSYFEMDRLGWEDTDAIQQLRRSYAQKDINTAPKQSDTGKNKHGAGPTYCLPFQQGACPLPDDHKHPCGFFARHICAFCMQETGRAYRHQERECRRKMSIFTDNAAKNLEEEHWMTLWHPMYLN